MKCPGCKKIIDKLERRTLSIQFVKLQGDELAIAEGEFKERRDKQAQFPPVTYWCPYCDNRPFPKIKNESQAIQILKET